MCTCSRDERRSALRSTPSGVAEAAAAPGQAWAAVFADAVEQGVAGVAAKSALYRADASAYDLVAAAEREVDVAAIDRMLHVLA